jgi:hypothetical protein
VTHTSNIEKVISRKQIQFLAHPTTSVATQYATSIVKPFTKISNTNRYTGSNLTHYQPDATSVPITIGEPHNASNVPLSTLKSILLTIKSRSISEHATTIHGSSSTPYNQQTSRTTSTSEDEEDSTHMPHEIPWQTVKGIKRKKKT